MTSTRSLAGLDLCAQPRGVIPAELIAAAVEAEETRLAALAAIDNSIGQLAPDLPCWPFPQPETPDEHAAMDERVSAVLALSGLGHLDERGDGDRAHGTHPERVHRSAKGYAAGRR